MPATAADREMVLRSFGATKVAHVDTPAPTADIPQDAKSKKKEGETTPEIVDLASASDTPPKKAPEKKPEEKSENKIDYTKTAGLLDTIKQLMGQRPLLSKILQQAGRGAGIGAGIGAGYGALSPAEGEGRVSSALRRGALGSLMGGGAGAGRALGQALPQLAPNVAGEMTSKTLGHMPLAGGIAGAGVGGAVGSAVSKAPKKPGSSSEEKSEKKPEKKDARQEAAKAASADTTEGVLPSASDMTPDKQAPQQKAVGKPSKLNETMRVRGLSKGAALPPTQTASDNKPEPKTPGGDIPVLGRTGGAVLGGLEKLLGGVGWEGGRKKLQEWGQSPSARNIAGGTTATLAAVAAALAARQALKGDDGMYAEASVRLDLVKKALMGQSAPPFKTGDGKNEQFRIPVRDGVVTTHRNEIFDNLSRWSLGR
jgi:hypothetical protein